MRRARRWRLVAVIVVAGVLSLAMFFLVAHLVFGNVDDLGPHPMKPKTADWAMHNRRITIPDGFAFEEGIEVREFVGANGYYGRYRAPGDFPAAERAVAVANPDFPAFRTAGCADEIVEEFARQPGFACGQRSQIVVSTRTRHGEDVLTDHYRGTPPDCETMLLAGDGDRVELFVASPGH